MRALALLALVSLIAACLRAPHRVVVCVIGVDTVAYSHNIQTGVVEGVRMTADGGFEKCDRIDEGRNLIAH